MYDNMMETRLLIGAGPMAVAYAHVLKALDQEYVVVGRGEVSAKSFCEATGVMPCLGGVDLYLADTSSVPDTAIVATSVEMLAETCEKLIVAGCKRILLEKPGAMDLGTISRLDTLATSNDVAVLLAYNRRFYSSVANCKRLVDEDGGVTSFNFEFTEWSHTIEPLQKAKGVKERWFLVNSTHVVDLAFYLGGKPNSMQCESAGSLPWHSRSNFSGSGVSETKALYSYHADWEAPGRWSVEILTKKHRFILCPLEKLQIQEIGSINVSFVDIDDQLDLDFKPGVYKQTEAFLSGDYKNFSTLTEQRTAFETYYKQICPY